jgi:hypothetical protein
VPGAIMTVPAPPPIESTASWRVAKPRPVASTMKGAPAPR